MCIHECAVCAHARRHHVVVYAHMPDPQHVCGGEKETPVTPCLRLQGRVSVVCAVLHLLSWQRGPKGSPAPPIGELGLQRNHHDRLYTASEDQNSGPVACMGNTVPIYPALALNF